MEGDVVGSAFVINYSTVRRGCKTRFVALRVGGAKHVCNDRIVGHVVAEISHLLRPPR